MNALRAIYRRLVQRYMLGYDLLLLGSMALLVLVGLLMIFSASASLSDRLHGSSLILLRNHLLHLAVGLMALAAGMRIPVATWRRAMPGLLLLCFVLLILVLIPGVGHHVGGARRWLRLGIMNFQPSELLKLALILFVASYLDRKQELLAQFFRGVVPSLTVMGVFLALVVMQPDFGTMVLIALTLLMMIFVGGAKPGHILFSLGGFAVVGVLLIMSRAYRMERILVFLDPWADRQDAGFQIIQSYLAFGAGGWFGVGLGDSTQKMFFLPDAHTDFIFSILAEETGLLGVVAVMALFGCFIWRSYAIALAAEDDFAKFVAYGIATLYGLQILLNLAVVMGALPTKGLPLPFISYGGSALVMTLFMSGVLLNIGRTGRARP
ncbi:MAG: putative lipid II flippase FtsW [Candidatus Lambdaproteobacteria bacterium]|nr:putative lipid II flippase FtsW [Candidatus Lambdaproteobacteria bacterium]